MKSSDQIDLLREQQKILSGEVALLSSSLKRLSEEASKNPQKDQIHVNFNVLLPLLMCSFDYLLIPSLRLLFMKVTSFVIDLNFRWR